MSNLLSSKKQILNHYNPTHYQKAHNFFALHQIIIIITISLDIQWKTK